MADSIHEDVLDRVVNVLQKMELDGYEQNVSWSLKLTPAQASNLAMPAIHVSPLGMEQPDPIAGTNQRDATGLPVTVRLLDRDCLDNPDKERTLLKVRQKVRQALRTRRPGDQGDAIVCNLLPSPTVEELPDAYRETSLPIQLVVVIREVRG